MKVRMELARAEKGTVNTEISVQSQWRYRSSSIDELTLQF